MSFGWLSTFQCFSKTSFLFPTTGNFIHMCQTLPSSIGNICSFCTHTHSHTHTHACSNALHTRADMHQSPEKDQQTSPQPSSRTPPSVRTGLNLSADFSAHFYLGEKSGSSPRNLPPPLLHLFLTLGYSGAWKPKPCDWSITQTQLLKLMAEAQLYPPRRRCL